MLTAITQRRTRRETRRARRLVSNPDSAEPVHLDGLPALGGPLTNAELQETRETEYRRGFCQGVEAALEATTQGHKTEALVAWYFRLRRWRRSDHAGRTERPERLGPPEQS